MANPRIFSLAEADQLLPLVRRITTDLRQEYGRWRSAVSAYELAVAGLHAGAEESEAARIARDEAEDQAARVQALVEELQGLGCELKDFERGLVDFYALLDDRLVFNQRIHGAQQLLMGDLLNALKGRKAYRVEPSQHA